MATGRSSILAANTTTREPLTHSLPVIRKLPSSKTLLRFLPIHKLHPFLTNHASCPENLHDHDLQPTTDRSPRDRHVLLSAGHRCAGQGLAFLRENDGITLSHRQRGIPRKTRRDRRDLRVLCFCGHETPTLGNDDERNRQASGVELVSAREE